jgi:hypothetical protein
LRRVRLLVRQGEADEKTVKLLAAAIEHIDRSSLMLESRIEQLTVSIQT